jgi:uncharacterized DUF497 family protein
MSIEYNFEWDPGKAKTNLSKHGVSFEAAATVFHDSQALTVYDEGHDDDEERWSTMGIAEGGDLLVVIHTFSEPPSRQEITIRLISARPATRKERRQYEASL